METHRFALHEGHDTVTAESRAFTLSIVLGATLVALGVAAYVLSDFASITAFIPAIFGALLAILGVVGQRRTERRRLAAYGIGLLAVLGVLGSTRGIPDIIALVTGGAVESTIAAVSQGAMILVCLVLLLAVLQFVRETRTAATP
jgi:membrane-associated HD superfamily phosphohydrolase